MQNDIAIIIEVWAGMRAFIPAKDRLAAADQLVILMDEHGLIDDIAEYDGHIDAQLSAAIKSYTDLGEDDDHDDE
jgi:hypothetical protein